MIIFRMGTRRNYHVLICRQFEKSIAESNFPIIKDTILQCGYGNDYRFTNNKIINKRTGSTCEFLGLKLNPNGIRGRSHIDLLWYEEAQDIPEDAIIAAGPTIRKVGSQIIASYNPFDPEDPIEILQHNTPADDKLEIECHWTMLDERYQTEVMFAEQRVCPEEWYPHVWDGEYAPAAGTNPFGLANLLKARNRPELPPYDIADDDLKFTGIDVAWSEGEGDWSTVVQIDRRGNVIKSERIQTDDYDTRMEFYEKHITDTFDGYVDTTEGLGRKILADLQKKGYKLRSYKFTRPTKNDLVANYTKLCALGIMAFLDHKTLYSEARLYGITETGGFEAVRGNDDLITAHMLAAKSLGEVVNRSSYNINSHDYLAQQSAKENGSVV